MSSGVQSSHWEVQVGLRQCARVSNAGTVLKPLFCSYSWTQGLENYFTMASD
jgi:hypothetical protein